MLEDYAEICFKYESMPTIDELPNLYNNDIKAQLFQQFADFNWHIIEGDKYINEIIYSSPIAKPHNYCNYITKIFVDNDFSFDISVELLEIIKKCVFISDNITHDKFISDFTRKYTQPLNDRLKNIIILYFAIVNYIEGDIWTGLK